jgi:hypothetical protein
MAALWVGSWMRSPRDRLQGEQGTIASSVMLPLDDPRWSNLHGGYRVPYDASLALRRLEQGEDVWDELCQELHHQGDVGEAAYASVPHIARIAGGLARRDWHFYGLVSTIEVERHRKSNPELPDWCAESYRSAWRSIVDLAIADLRTVSDPLILRSILGAIALARGDLRMGALLSTADASEIDEYLEQHLSWSEEYGQDANSSTG